MNRKMRRMLEKKGGINMNDPMIQSMMDASGNGLGIAVLKNPEMRKVFSTLKKYRKLESDITCPHCGETIHTKGIVAQCDKCKKWICVCDVCDKEKDECEHCQIQKAVDAINESINTQN